jgi:hypothetical protein
MTVSMNFKQACTALERTIVRVDGKPRLKSCYVDLEHIPEYAGKDMGVAVSDVAESLKGWREPVPTTLLEQLDLSPECNVVDVAAAVDVLWRAPIMMTPEEEAADEMATLELSELIEQANARNPDLPQSPVATPETKQ